MALQPVTATNRVGHFIVAGGSADDADNGNVSTSLIDPDAGEDWSDVLTKTTVTTPHTDGVRGVLIRCPRGTWVDDDGNRWFNRCNANGVVVRVPGPFHAYNVALQRGAYHLVTGYDTFLTGLNALGWCVVAYNNGLPNTAHPTTGVLENWQDDPLTQDGYPDIVDVNTTSFFVDLYGDELQYGAHMAFDGCGQDRSAYMVSNWLYPRLASVTAGFNEYAREVFSEANCVRTTAAWQADYSFVAANPTFSNRIGDNTYLQPDEMAYTPGCIIQGSTQADYDIALALAPTYRVWVKWVSMKATVGATAMAALLAAGEGDPVDPTTATAGDAWLKIRGGRRGWWLRSAGFRRW